VRVRNAAKVAQAAVMAVESQTARLPGEDVAAELVAALEREMMVLDARIKAVDAATEQRFRRHQLADVITRMPTTRRITH
jgi:hypothetical protein